MPHYAIALFESAHRHIVAAEADLQLHPLGDRWQVACLPLADTDLEQFGRGEDRDPAWLAQALTRQHAAVSRMGAALPIYPLAFGTLLEDFAELEAAASAAAPLLDAYFAQVRGCGEWGLRIRATAEALEAPAPTHSGLAWLQHRRDAGRRRQEQRRERLETALTLVAAHLDPVLRARTERPPSSGLAEDPQTLVNVALLAPFAEDERLEAALQALDAALAPHGLSLRLSGPWAPYSFRPRLGEVAL
ncbi:MAG: GvpL/GvpF family gas vesicle protein [Xanthomonadales bacterium]|jgi:hypothetical protein|nr:GvpL/GvpF family gas vesicle protein [Xanthomonadales bacterium]